jgi:hypothetical protein
MKSPTDVFSSLLVAFFLVAFVVAGIWFQYSRAKAILDAWAASEGFTIQSFDRCYFGTGPFRWWTNGRGQVVYHVRVRDRSGEARSGWVRCGGYFGGVLFSNRTEVRWEER